MKIKNALFVASVAAIAASSHAAFSYSTGFESSEGWNLGLANGQNGYTVFTAAPNGPIISNVNPNGGSQHLRLGPDTSASVGTLNGVFSPEFATGSNDIYTLSLDIAIGATGGADYDIAGQDTAAGLINFRVKFSWLGNILVQSTSGFVDTGALWNEGGYNNLTVVQNIANNSITYSYGGSQIYTDTNWNSNTGLNQIVMFSDNFHIGEFGDIDNVVLTGEAVPEPMTMGVLAAGLAAAAAARRKRK